MIKRQFQQCDFESIKFSFRQNSKLVKKFPTMEQTSISTRNLAAKKVNPVETFAKVLENFIVIWHRCS